MAGITNTEVGAVIPVSVQIVDGATDQYPQAVVYDDQGNLLTTLNLSHEANGLYVPASPYVMPDEVFVKITYIVYEDSGHTTESDAYLRDLDVFMKIDPGNYRADVSALATTAQLNAAESNIRGVDADDLKTISDQIDALPQSATWSEAEKNTIVNRVMEVWQLYGLDISNPMTVTPATRQAASIDQAISGDGVNTTTVTRQ